MKTFIATVLGSAIGIMLAVFCLLFLFTCSRAEAKSAMVKVAVIDSGFSNFHVPPMVVKRLCNKGHRDFTKKSNSIGVDSVTNPHGSLVTHMVAQNANIDGYCIVIYKVELNVISRTMYDALIYAANNNVKYVNLSLFYFNPNKRLNAAVKMMTERGIKLFVVAGNQGMNMDTYCTTFPACFKDINDNMIVVGATNVYGDTARYSNVGSVVDSYIFGDYNIRVRGTSFAAPRALAKQLRLDLK